MTGAKFDSTCSQFCLFVWRSNFLTLAQEEKCSFKILFFLLFLKASSTEEDTGIFLRQTDAKSKMRLLSCSRLDLERRSLNFLGGRRGPRREEKKAACLRMCFWCNMFQQTKAAEGKNSRQVQGENVYASRSKKRGDPANLSLSSLKMAVYTILFLGRGEKLWVLQMT